MTNLTAIRHAIEYSDLLLYWLYALGEVGVGLSLFFIRNCPCQKRSTPLTRVVNVLHVAGGAVRFTTRRAMTRRASGSRRHSIYRGVKRLVTTRTRQASFLVSSNSRNNLHPLIVQRVKLIAAPLLI